MEDELLVGPNHFTQSRDFDLLQDDFLDLAADESHHSADMALCLQSGSPPSLASKDELRSSSTTSEPQMDNPSMKLDNLDSWDQDVLLSNAGLPETNPLLMDQDLDNSVSEDFQKMLNEWEHHIGSLQTADIPDVDLMVPNEVTSGTTTSSTSNVIENPDPEIPGKNFPKILRPLQTIRDDQAGHSKMTLGQMALAGIVISSGPGDHFETYEVSTSNNIAQQKQQIPQPQQPQKQAQQQAVLEATDAESLLDQFEEAATSDVEAEENPKKTSNIYKAVKNHFAASGHVNPKRNPRIVPSQRIKDVLPKEIIERIKKSSQKSRTIAIIEPVQHDKSKPNDANIKPMSKPSIITKSHIIQPPTTRFQDAANSLNKSKHLRLISSTQQVQVSLDHDYCSSLAKLKRGHHHHHHHNHHPRPNHHIISPSSSMSSPRPLIRIQPAGSNTTVVTKPSSIVVSSPMTSKSIVRVNPDATVITMPIAVEVASASGASASSPLSSPARKDSGLESGEASDASDSHHATSTTSSSCDLYSKVPSYLTTVNVMNSDSSSINTEEDPKNYDRLPAYVKGVPRRIVIQTSNSASKASTPSSSSDLTSCIRTRRNRSSSSNSSGDHSSTETGSTKPEVNRMATRSRTSTTSVVTSVVTPSGAVRRRRQSSSSSSSSSSELRSPRQKKRRSWRKPSNKYDQDLRSRSPDQPPREVQRRKQRQVEERRVVYVGRITEGTTRADLRKRFETFGAIEEISVHFRDRGDNYGFVTFRNKADAFNAIEQGNDDTSYPKVDLCFGGRRAFCKEKYSDLDSRSFLPNGAKTARVVTPTPLEVEENEDFDSLLKQARAGIRK